MIMSCTLNTRKEFLFILIIRSLKCMHFLQAIISRYKSQHDVLTVIDYIHTKTMMDIQILVDLYVIHDMIETSRVQGVDIEDMYIRGSQFRVENLYLRLNHEFNYIFRNASEKEVFFYV